MILEEKTTHNAEALSWLIDRFKDSIDFKSWLSAYLAQIQEIEAVLFTLLTMREIDSSDGEQLNIIGRIVGEDRKGKTDATYRLYLKARIQINLSSGTPEQLYTIMGLITANTASLREWYPAAFSIIISDALSEDIDSIASIISTSRGAGIGVDIEYTLAEDDYTFSFASGDSPEADSNKGFSNDGGTSGGKFADAVGA